MQPDQSAGYRPDIDGLRAIAVLSVLAYHYGVGLPGGFSGVDVFFVISGYLITSRISRELQAGTFSLVDFYDRRIRRIVPALLVMLLVSLALGKFLLMPGDYRSTAISAALAAFGLSNFYFNANTGYFDQASDLMPLIHTWSLAVEEQFYFVWPLLLMGFGVGRSRTKLAALVGAITIVGFISSLFWFAADSKSAFYIALPRAWELAIGGLLVFLPSLSRAIGEWAAIAGIALMGLGFLTLTAKEFPGAAAAIPCLGAALVIWPRKEATIAAAWLGRLSPIGLISYSLYLWHWPVWVFFRFYINSGTPGPRETAALAVVSIAIATVSYRFVELPFRRRQTARAGRALLFGPAAGMAVFCVGVYVFSTGGLPNRISSNYQGMRSGDVMWAFPCKEATLIPSAPPFCTFGARSWNEPGEKALLWGDSNAQQLAPMLSEVAKERGVSVALYEQCPANIDGEKTAGNYPDDWNERCRKHRSELWPMIEATPDIRTIVIGGSWGFAQYYLVGKGDRATITNKLDLFERSLADLAEEVSIRGRRLVIVSMMPQYMHDPTSCHMRDIGLLRRQCKDSERFLTQAEATSWAAETLERIQRVAASHPNVTVIVPTVGLCPTEHCITSLNGETIYRDGVHFRRNLREDTNRELARLIGLDRVFSE